MIVVLSMAAMLLVAGAASGSTVVYTDKTSFTAALDAGYYLEEFDDCNTWGAIASPMSRGPDANGWQYDVSASHGNLWGLDTDGEDGCVSTGWLDAVMTITPTGTQQVNAIGGYFFATNWAGNLVAGAIHVELSDGTEEDYTSSASAYDFRGFISSVPITSLSVSVPGNPHSETEDGAYPTLDHVYVGTPEPATVAFLALGGIGMLARRIRRKA
jgi:hypothetical protein